MILSHISKNILNHSSFNNVYVIDSGFLWKSIPNATLYTPNNPSNLNHGTTVAKILSHTHKNLNLSLYALKNKNMEDLEHIFNLIPDNQDVLNLSLSWNVHSTTILNHLISKFKYIIIAHTENTYPTIYKNYLKDKLITVSMINKSADFYIPVKSIFNMSGNSAVTPIISSMFCHNPLFYKENDNLISIQDLYHNSNQDNNVNSNIYYCKYCGHKLYNKYCRYCNSLNEIEKND